MICEKLHVANLYQTKDNSQENKLHYPIITKESFKERKQITHQHSHSPPEYPKEQTKETILSPITNRPPLKTTRKPPKSNANDMHKL